MANKNENKGSDDDIEMFNGRCVSDALVFLKNFVTENELLECFVTSSYDSVEPIRSELKRILDIGVKNGFIVRNGNKYTLTNLANAYQTDADCDVDEEEVADQAPQASCDADDEEGGVRNANQYTLSSLGNAYQTDADCDVDDDDDEGGDQASYASEESQSQHDSTSLSESEAAACVIEPTDMEPPTQAFCDVDDQEGSDQAPQTACDLDDEEGGDKASPADCDVGDDDEEEGDEVSLVSEEIQLQHDSVSLSESGAAAENCVMEPTDKEPPTDVITTETLVKPKVYVAAKRTHTRSESGNPSVPETVIFEATIIAESPPPDQCKPSPDDCEPSPSKRVRYG